MFDFGSTYQPAFASQILISRRLHQSRTLHDKSNRRSSSEAARSCRSNCSTIGWSRVSGEIKLTTIQIFAANPFRLENYLKQQPF